MKPPVILTSVDELTTICSDPQSHIDLLRGIKRILGDGPYYWYQIDHEEGFLLTKNLPQHYCDREEVLDVVDYYTAGISEDGQDVLIKFDDVEEIVGGVPGAGDIGQTVELVDMRHLISTFAQKDDQESYDDYDQDQDFDQLGHSKYGQHLRQIHRLGDNIHDRLPGPEDIADQMD
jgi:hypothetical protein